MERTALTDGTGAWFDKDTSERFSESVYWDGSNQVSKATGSYWTHEQLFHTASCKWVLNRWSQLQGTAETYIQITEEHAAEWLVQNDHYSDVLRKEIEDLQI